MTTEFQYARGKTRTQKKSVSPLCPENGKKSTSKTLGPVGGDRMIHHGYASTYSSCLKPWMRDRNRKLTIVEVGILHGTGLAIWCDLFPNSRCIGLDLNPSFFHEYQSTLISRGAFSLTQPDVYEFDQFADNRERIAEILDGNSIDICIDDGCHHNEAILKTFECINRHLSKEFVYFIEDNSYAYKLLKSKFPLLMTENYGELTVVVPDSSST